MYEDLTKLLNQLDDGPYGEWIIDKENDGSPEHPLQFPYVHFLNEVVGDLMDTVYHYANNGHDYLFRYDETIRHADDGDPGRPVLRGSTAGVL